MFEKNIISMPVGTPGGVRRSGRTLAKNSPTGMNPAKKLKLSMTFSGEPRTAQAVIDALDASAAADTAALAGMILLKYNPPGFPK